MSSLKKKLIIVIIICLLFCTISIIHNIILKKIYPIEYNDYIEDCSIRYGLDKYLICAIIKNESKFKEDAISSSGAIGLMQLMEKTANEIAEKIQIQDFSNEMLYNPKINIELGVKYYTDLLDQFENEYIALAAYNAGIGNVSRWIENGVIKKDGSDIENIPFRETNMYIRKIIRDYDIYKKIYLN